MSDFRPLCPPPLNNVKKKLHFSYGMASLTDSLTHWLLFRKLDWYDPVIRRWQLKLVEVVTVAHVDDEKRVDSLVQIWKVKFGHKVKFLFRLWGQGFKVWSRFWGWFSGKILKLKFGHYFAADAWLWLWSSILLEILKLGLVKIFEFKFCRNANVWLIFWNWCLDEILKMFDQDLCKNLWYDLKKLLW